MQKGSHIEWKPYSVELNLKKKQQKVLVLCFPKDYITLQSF